MRDRDTYIMLISSLPRPEALFLAKVPPLSRLKLNRRLRLLSKEDREKLALVENVLSWRNLPMSSSESDVIHSGNLALERVNSRTLRKIVRERLEIRTCIAALRRRAQGEAPPTAPWGFGRWVKHIEKHWNEIDFGLGRMFPWLKEAHTFMREGKTADLERLILDECYKRLQRATSQHLYDVEAVIIYVLKWNIIERVTRYNAERAARRFDDMTHDALGEYAQLKFAGEV